MAATRDGFIARASDHSPSDWVSSEEQVLFRRDVASADWSIMGRHTHEAAPNAERRRIVFSTRDPGWHRPTQLWCDPERLEPGDLPSLVSHVHPLESGLILGGTRVHDWFLSHRAIDAVHLTVEPVEFGAGLPIFTDQSEGDPEAIFAARRFRTMETKIINSVGTRWLRMEPY